MKHSTETLRLPNGIELLLINIAGTKNFELSIACRAGYRQATRHDPNKYETPHFLEHLVFDGSRLHPSHDALQDIFSTGGGVSNGITTPYHNIFVFHNRTSNAEQVLTTALDMVFHPLLTEQSFTEETRVIVNELEDNLGNIARDAHEQTQQQILPDFIVSTDSQLHRLRNIAHEDVLDYHRLFYGTNNAQIIIATDLTVVSKSKLVATITTATKDAHPGVRQPTTLFEIAPPSKKTMFMPIDKSIVDTIANCHFVAPRHPDLKEVIALSLFCNMSECMKSYSVVYKLRKQGFTYGLSFAPFVAPEVHGLMLEINARTTKFNDVFAHTIAGIRDLARDGVSKAQYESAITDYLDSLEDAEATVESIVDWYTTDFLMDMPIDTVEDIREILHGLKQPYVLQYVRDIFNIDHMYASVFSSKGRGAATSISLLSKAILVDNSPVDTKLMEDKSLSLQTPSRFEKVIIGAFIMLGAALIAPACNLLTSQPTISDHLAEFADWWKWVLLAYFVFTCIAMLWGDKDLIQEMIAYQGSFILLMFLIMWLQDPASVLPAASSGDSMAMWHYWTIMIGVTVLTLLTTGNVIVNKLRKRRSLSQDTQQ